MSDMDKIIGSVKGNAESAIADGKKTSHNVWFWVALAVGLILGFGVGKLF